MEPEYYRYDTVLVHCSRGYNTSTGTVRQTTLRLYQYATYGTPKTVPCTVLDLDLDLARSTCSTRYSSTRSSNQYSCIVRGRVIIGLMFFWAKNRRGLISRSECFDNSQARQLQKGDQRNFDANKPPKAYSTYPLNLRILTSPSSRSQAPILSNASI